MRPSANSFFSIGKSHLVCQDRALAGFRPDGTPFAIVCDGCSSSPDTDIGAWMLAKSAFVYLSSGYTMPIDLRVVLAQAGAMQMVCEVPSRALDATLLIAYVRDDMFVVEAFGDGVVTAQHRDGHLEVREIEFPSGAPAYPNYQRESSRLADYLRMTSNAERHVKDQFGFPLNQFGFGHSYFTFHRRDFTNVSVLSDGAASFRRMEGSSFVSVPTLEVLPHLVGFKNFAGDFVTRRVRRFLTKEMVDLGWHHDDDLSVATIHIQEAPEE